MAPDRFTDEARRPLLPNGQEAAPSKAPAAKEAAKGNPEADSPTAIEAQAVGGHRIRMRKVLPDWLQSVNLTHVKLGYHYVITHGMLLLLVPIFVSVGVEISRLQPADLMILWEHLNSVAQLNLVAVLVCSCLLVFAITMYLATRSRSVYLVDFACYLPTSGQKASYELFLHHSKACGVFDEKSLDFQQKILERSGLGDETYLPAGVCSIPPDPSMANARIEAEEVMYGALDELFQKTGVKPKEVGILVVNCSLFCPTPSLSAMIINKYGMSGSIKSYNLGGMGCSAGVISVDLARDMLQLYGATYAVVVSTENITQNWYFGNKRSMLIPNCLFRMGGAAVLLSNKGNDWWRAKYQLVHTVRTHMGADNKCFRCVVQEEDDKKNVGVSLSKDLMAIAGDALKTNITTLGPLVLPLSEQLLFFAALVGRKVLGIKMKPYIPDFKLAFEHFCIHAGGRAVLDELEKNLQLKPWHLEPSRMTLYRFGNTSSSSIWYELAYSEAKGRIRRGDRIWQIAFGSGFKCNSAVWRALRKVTVPKGTGAWRDCIDTMPVDLKHLD